MFSRTFKFRWLMGEVRGGCFANSDKGYINTIQSVFLLYVTIYVVIWLNVFITVRCLLIALMSGVRCVVPCSTIQWYCAGMEGVGGRV